jgi:hypothetical protein
VGGAVEFRSPAALAGLQFLALAWVCHSLAGGRVVGDDVFDLGELSLDLVYLCFDVAVMRGDGVELDAEVGCDGQGGLAVAEDLAEQGLYQPGRKRAAAR